MMTMSPGGSNNSNSKLFIGGLSYETTDESLGQYFSQFGQVLSAVVLRDQETGRSRGFGFVTFVTPDSAQNALGNHHHIVDGRKVESKLAVPRRKTDSDEFGDSAPPTPLQQRTAPMLVSSSHVAPTPTSARSSPILFSPNTTTTTSTNTGRESMSPTPNGDIIANKIFVGGLRYATSHEVLKSYFEQYGEVDTAQVIFNRDTKKSRGFGFVVFRDSSSVDRVLATQKSNPPTIEGKQVEVKTCVARQDSMGSPHNGSPRAVPQTPIVTRSDSYSSITSTSSLRVPVSATPVRPNSVFGGLPSVQGGVRDPWGISSPVVFDTIDSHNNLNNTDRRASFASIRSNSPFGFQPGNVGGIQNDGFGNETGFIHSPFTSPNVSRDSPSLFYPPGSRLQQTFAVPSSQQRPREDSFQQRPREDSFQRKDDSSFSIFPPPSANAHQLFSQPRESAFTVPDNNNGNHDTGLFDMSAFAAFNLNAATASAATIGENNTHSSSFRRLGQETPPPVNPGLGFGAFKPLTSPPPTSSSNVSSPSKPVVVAKSPLLDHLGSGQGLSLGFTNGKIW